MLVACAADPAPHPVLVQPKVELRILAGAGRAIVYAREPDRPCRCNWGEFPVVGMCEGISDTPKCACDPTPASCIERIAVESEGETLGAVVTDTRREGLELELDLPGLATSVAPQLVVEGCGGRAEIPLGTPGPMPTVTVTRASENVGHVEWTNDRPSTSAMLANSFGVYAEVCLVTAQTYELQIPWSATAYVEVRALDAPVSYTTPIGTALVYPTGFSETSMVPL